MTKHNYETNVTNLVAVNTSVGLTDRVNIPRIVMQGGTFGPILCSNSIDKVGKTLFMRGESLFLYKKMVPIMPLSMVDDLLAFAPCGFESIALNTYINTQIELKKLRFHTKTPNKKSKCHTMHIGKPNHNCPNLQVHGTMMERVNE